jgi:hypothetical protein
MKIITRGVLDWDGNVLEQDSFEYSGPVADCKSSGSAPAPVDPYTQAAAQYGLDTGTANYNAELNRTNSSNPLGSNTWSVSGGGGSGGYGPYPLPSSAGGGMYGFGGGGSSMPGFNYGGVSIPGGGVTGTGSATGGSGAPHYSQQTSLTPWANKMLASPIDTTGLAGMPGGPSTTQDLAMTRNSLYDQQQAYIKPQQDLAAEQLDSKLANQGIMPGSAAYQQAKDQQGRENTFTNNQTINSAITGGGAEQSRLFGLGSQGLQNQLAVRQAPISEYESLTGNPSSNVSAATPDISGAFGQQYNGALAGYNAGVATDNSNTGAAASVAMMAAIYF